jgi:hypothetical protein
MAALYDSHHNEVPARGVKSQLRTWSVMSTSGLNGATGPPGLDRLGPALIRARGFPSVAPTAGPVLAEKPVVVSEEEKERFNLTAERDDALETRPA